jgi:hypothetical protein
MKLGHLSCNKICHLEALIKYLTTQDTVMRYVCRPQVLSDCNAICAYLVEIPDPVVTLVRWD